MIFFLPQSAECQLKENNLFLPPRKEKKCRKWKKNCHVHMAADKQLPPDDEKALMSFVKAVVG